MESDAIEYNVELHNSNGDAKVNQIKLTAKRKLCINKTVLILYILTFVLHHLNHLLLILF